MQLKPEVNSNLDSKGILANPIGYIVEHSTAVVLCGSLIIVLMSLYLQTLLVLLVIPLLLLGIYVGLKSLLVPFIFLVFTIVGNYLGNIGSVFGEDFIIPLSIFQIFYILTICVLMMHLIYNSQFKIRITGLEPVILLFYVLVLGSLIYSPNQESGLVEAGRMITLTFLPLLILNIIRNEKQIYWLFIVIIVVSLIFGVISIRYTFLNPEIALVNMMSRGVRIVGRSTIGQIDPNVFATFFFLPIVFSLCLAFSKKLILQQLPYLAISGILMIAIFATFSRSAMVSSFVMIVIAAIYYKQFRLIIYALVVLILAFLFIPDLRISAESVLQRIMDIFAGTRDDSSRIRILQAEASIYMFLDSKLLGVGFRGYPIKIHEYFTAQQTIGVIEPHNMLYTIMAELGLLGLFLFTFIIYRIVGTGMWNVKNSPSSLHKAIAVSTLSTFVAFCVFYQFIGIGFSNNNAWMLFGLIFAQNLMIKEQSNSGKSSVKAAANDP